jgi:hypothetical protein
VTSLPSLPTRSFWRGTLIGTLGSPARPGVGTAGWLRIEGGWELGWWVGAEDRWHLPEVETAVRQRLIEETPVVETAMRIPGGDALERVFAAAGSEVHGPLAVMEIENASAVPVAAAVVVRGLADRLSVEADDDGAVVRFTHTDADSIEPRVAEHRLLFERPPAQMAQVPGLAVFVFPLAHTATLRAAVPLEAPRSAPTGAGPGAVPGANGSSAAPRAADGEARPGGFPGDLPPATVVAKGWEAQGGRGVRIELPESTLVAAVEATRRALLLAELGDGTLVGGPRGGPDRVGAQAVTGAFDRLGFSPEAERVVARLETDLGVAGAVDDTGRVDTAGAALAALVHHVEHVGDRGLAEASVELVSAVATGLRRRALPVRRLGRASRLPEPLGNAPGSEAGASWWTWWWVAAGLDAAARLFSMAGQNDAAGDARRDLVRLGEALVEPMAADRTRTGGPLPARPGGDMDGTAAAALWPAGLLGRRAATAGLLGHPAEAAADARPAATAGAWPTDTAVWVAAHGTDERGRVLPDPERSGLTRPLLTALLARAEIAAGWLGAVGRLTTLVADAGGMRTWPEVYDPTRPTVSGRGACPDTVAAATVVHGVLDLLVSPRADGLVLLGVVPPTWYGHGIEVHDAPTPFGSLSYAVRWHGDRPALLWQLDAHDGVEPDAVRLCVPGLDPSWSSTQPRGEALLSAPLDGPSAAPSSGASSSPVAPPASGRASPAAPSSGGSPPDPSSSGSPPDLSSGGSASASDPHSGPTGPAEGGSFQ